LAVAQNQTSEVMPEQTITNKNWISERDNLNITIIVNPKIPIIDRWTSLNFTVQELNSSRELEGNFTANTTITDHDGRLFKFPAQSVENGEFSVEYIFPDDGQHRVILQLYKDLNALTVASFDLNIPHPQPENSNFFSQLFQTKPF